MSVIEPKLYGDVLFRLLPDRPVMRDQEVHTLAQRWQAPSRNQFRIGAIPDGWPGMRIVAVEPEEEIEDAAYELRIDCEGIADGSDYLELDHVEDSGEEGWDVVAKRLYLTAPDAARWRKGEQLQADALTGVSAAAATDLLQKPGHGMVTGQMCYLDHSGGFGGIVSARGYFAHVVDADTFRLAHSNACAVVAGVSVLGSLIDITAVASTNVISAVAHGLANGDVVVFPVLSGGVGLVVLIVPYYVIAATADTFKVSLTPGGSEVDISTDVSSGKVRKGSYIDITSDGVGGTLRPVMRGFENLWITDRRKSKARGCEASLKLGIAGYYYLDLQFKGRLAGDGDSKPVKRRINTTGQTVANDAYPGIIYSPVYQGYPPQVVSTTVFGPPVIPGTMAAEFDLPQISVTDVILSTEPPPTSIVPGHWIPNDAPSVVIISTGYGDPDAFTYHYPRGWKVLNLQSEQIGDKAVWLISLTWGYQIAATPRSTAS